MISKNDINFAWMMENQQLIADAMNSVEALKNASIQISGSSSRSGMTQSGARATLILPIKLPPIDKSTDVTNAAVVLNKLIDSLRAAGMM